MVAFDLNINFLCLLRCRWGVSSTKCTTGYATRQWVAEFSPSWVAMSLTWCHSWHPSEQPGSMVLLGRSPKQLIQSAGFAMWLRLISVLSRWRWTRVLLLQSLSIHTYQAHLVRKWDDSISLFLYLILLLTSKNNINFKIEVNKSTRVININTFFEWNGKTLRHTHFYLSLHEYINFALVHCQHIYMVPNEFLFLKKPYAIFLILFNLKRMANIFK